MRGILQILRGNKSSNLDDKCTICKSITAVRYMRGEVSGAVLSELSDADMILTIAPIKSHIGNPRTQLRLCKKHHRLLFKSMDQLIDSTIPTKVYPPQPWPDAPTINR